MPFFWNRRRRANQPTGAARAAHCIAHFLRKPEHAWISSHQALRDRMAHFLSQIPEPDLFAILEEKKLLLLYCNQKMSCSFYQFEGREVILIFPDLRRLLLSAEFLQAYAILAHELGHVIHSHSKKQISPLQAQVEADRYASELGFTSELTLILENEGQFPEITHRLNALRK